MPSFATSCHRAWFHSRLSQASALPQIVRADAGSDRKGQFDENQAGSPKAPGGLPEIRTDFVRSSAIRLLESAQQGVSTLDRAVKRGLGRLVACPHSFQFFVDDATDLIEAAKP